MTQSAQITEQTLENAIAQYFRQSEGAWKSRRRYYTLKSGETQEVMSFLTVQFLSPDSPELIQLAALHQLEANLSLACGILSTWKSHYSIPQRKQSEGSTIFGVLGNVLYRDRGFATSKPVIANYFLRDPKTMCLKTEYNGSIFEEEIKLIGTQYRTRQTIISRLGEEQMIGQYLETRIETKE
jgi:CpeS-like protein